MNNKIFDNLETNDSNFLNNKNNIIISIQQRTTKKMITKIEGLANSDLKKIIKDLQKILQTSGHIEVNKDNKDKDNKDNKDKDNKDNIIFQGDKRIEIINYLIKNNLAIIENIKMRGF